MFSERPAAIPFPEAAQDAFSVDACAQDVNRRFAKFLAEDFDGLYEGGLPVELLRMLVDLRLGVASSDRHSRELAWLRHAFEERLSLEPRPYPRPFVETVELLRDLLGDPFPAVGLLEAVMRRSSDCALARPVSSVSRLPSPPPAPHGLDGFTGLMRVAEAATEKTPVDARAGRPFMPLADAPTERPPRQRAPAARPPLTSPPTWRPTRGPRLTP